MQTTGEEKTFQTLFRDLRLEDEHIAPRFVAVWNRAQANTRPRSGFRLSYIAAALLIVALLSLTFWLRLRSREGKLDTAASVQTVTPIVDSAPMVSEREPDKILPHRSRHRVNVRRAMRLAERSRERMRTLKEADILDAIAVSTWQSPTAMLMQSPADDLVISLPQMYRSVNEVTLFLSDTQK